VVVLMLMLIFPQGVVVTSTHLLLDKNDPLMTPNHPKNNLLVSPTRTDRFNPTTQLRMMQRLSRELLDPTLLWFPNTADGWRVLEETICCRRRIRIVLSLLVGTTDEVSHLVVPG
jgi:hypothetical protein